MNKQIEGLCYDYCLTLGDIISIWLMMIRNPNYTVTKDIFTLLCLLNKLIVLLLELYIRLERFERADRDGLSKLLSPTGEDYLLAKFKLIIIYKIYIYI